jgi:DNA-binding CsgD family transcriptional regulator
LVADAVAGVIVTDTGDTVPLPGLPDHRLLAPGSPVLSAATAQLAHAVPHVVFLCPDPDPDDGTPLTRVTAMACPAGTPGHLRAIAMLSPPSDLHALTRRELEVLGRLIGGDSNTRIAAALSISERTVAAHIEHILTKLNVSSRTAAGVRALRQGLYIPYITPQSAR